MNRNILLITDMQNDFCNSAGSLFVPGAETDIRNLVNFIDQNRDVINGIILTQDNHQVIDIAHPYFWVNEKGNHPNPFTGINVNDVQTGKWIPLFETEKVINYLEALDIQGEFPHTIWPEHCIWGSWGAAIVNEVQFAVNNWARQGRFFTLISKGLNPYTEHFGALRANIVMKNDHSTGLNKKLVDKLAWADTIYIAGEARSHCVANTISQILENKKIGAKLVIMDDCMSNVPGFDTIADHIYEMALDNGATIQKSNEIKP